MGGNLHRGFESLPLRCPPALAHRGRRYLAALRAPAAAEVSEDASQRAKPYAQIRVARDGVELVRIATQVVELALPALVVHIEPAGGAHRAPGWHARLLALGPA